MNIADEIKEMQYQIIEWRRQLHKIPEIAYDLYKTSEYVTKKLEEMKIEYRVVAKTGIIGTIYGAKPGKTIALRADMDALPVKEETGLNFAADNDFMHACGHDAHMAILLGAAKFLSNHKEQLAGNVRLIFQPAEENVGGAEEMIREGCLVNPKVDAVVGLHIGSLTAEVGCGQIGVRSGAMMAAVDDFRIRINGKGGHGAAPHECIDPIVISAEIISSLQKIVSRELAPVNPAVMTIGKIQGGTAFNIIPENVDFEGCVRTLSEEDRTTVEQRIRDIVSLTVKANRASCDIDYLRKYPVLINNQNMTDLVGKAAASIVGVENVISIKKPIMASEDMAYYLKEVPGTFFYLGSNNADKGIVYPHHHPKFNVDEDVIWIGSAVMVQTALDYLKE